MKEFSRHIFKYLLILSIIFTSVLTSYSKTVYCRLSGIQGFEVQAQEAELYFNQSKTLDFSKAEIYVSMVDGELYMHSNFLREGYPYPFKFSTDEPKRFNFLYLIESIATAHGDLAPPKNLRKNYRNDVKLYLDQSVLNSRTIRINKTKNVYVTGYDSKKWLIKDRGKNFQVYLDDQKMNVSVKVSDAKNVASEMKGVIDNLENPLSKERIKLLPLIDDTATNNTITDKISNETLLSMKNYSEENIKKVFESNKGKTVFVLSHYDKSNNSFSIINAEGKEKFKIKPDDLEKRAKENDITLFILGCEYSKLNRGSGAYEKFNSIDAVNNFAEALDSSKNHKEFLEILAKDFEIAINEKDIKEGMASIEAIILDKRSKQKVGKIRIYIPRTPVQVEDEEEENILKDDDDFEGNNDESEPSVCASAGSCVLCLAVLIIFPVLIRMGIEQFGKGKAVEEHTLIE